MCGSDVENSTEHRSGRQSVSDETIAKEEEAMLKDRRVTVWQLYGIMPAKPSLKKFVQDGMVRIHGDVARGSGFGERNRGRTGREDRLMSVFIVVEAETTESNV
ncbi:hypothetical protein Trydic_g17869 [Trypoxylus dichotomus]